MHDHALVHRGSALGALRVALVTTAVLLFLEIGGAVLAGSLALAADAAHLLADLGGLALSYTAAHLALRPATAKRSYGLHRVEILATLANSALLLCLSGFITYEAVLRLSSPPPLKTGWMLGVAATAVVGNLIALTALRQHAGRSLNMRGAYLEVLADTFGALGVLVAAAVILPTGWTIIDPILSCVLSLAIVPRTFRLLWEAVHVLIEGTPSGLDCPAIESAIKDVAGVAAVHDLHVWSLTSGIPVLTAHVVAEDDGGDDLLDRISERLKELFEIEHTTIQIERVDRTTREHPHF
jgi:cobalt-zinc-cadmium efflux system protein